MLNADKDIQIAAMVCSTRYAKLGKEQAARRERALELMRASGELTGAEASDGEQVRPLEMFYNKVHLLASKVADCPELLVSTDVQFLQLTAVDDDDNDESAAMSVTTPPHPVSAGSLPTPAGTSAVDPPVVAGDELASGLQDMTMGMATPTKMSMWEGIAATAVLSGPAIPGDVVIMTIDSQTKVDVELSEPVPVWGCVGKVLHHTRGHPELRDYTVAVLVVCNTDLTTHTKLIRVARSGFDVVAREEVIIQTGTPLGSGEPAAGSVCGQQAPRDYTAGSVPDIEHADGRRRQLSTIIRLNKKFLSVQVDPSTKEPICRRDEMIDQLKWQVDRFSNGRADDAQSFDLHDVDAAYTIMFLMVRALENGGPVACVSPELCVFVLQEQARRELTQHELHEVTHWHGYFQVQLKSIKPDFTVDSDGTVTFVKVAPVRARMTHSVKCGNIFGHGPPGHPYPDAVTANLLPTVEADLILQCLDDWQLPTTVPHAQGRCVPTRMCGRCGEQRDDPAFDHCNQCVTSSVEKSVVSRLAVPIKEWHDCCICGESVPTIEAGVLVDADRRQVCVHDRHAHLHCLRQIVETEKRCPSCKVPFVTAVAAPDAVCKVGEVVVSQSAQTGWDSDMERKADDLYVQLRAGDAALTQKVSAIKGEEKKTLKALDVEKTTDLRKRVAGLAELTAMDKTVEKQRKSTTETQIKADRKKLEKLIKEVANHGDRQKTAEEELELKVGEVERKAADKVTALRATHKAAMDKMAAVAANVEAQTRELMDMEQKHAEQTAVYSERVNQGKSDVQAAKAAVDCDFEVRSAQVAAATEQLVTEEKEAHADVSGKLRAALAKLEDRAGTTYATLQAIRQAEQDSSRPKAKRQRRTPTQQSTKEFLAEMQANQQQAATTAADHATDVLATPQEVLDESMDSAVSATTADVTMTPTCLMAVTDDSTAGAQADPLMNPRCSEPLVRRCSCWGQAVPFCLRCNSRPGRGGSR